MQFTPQQLVGAGRYAPTTRIGNWNEDLMLEEARMQEFQLRKKQGSLLATHKLKSDFLHQRAPRSFDAHQALHFNFAVGIAHQSGVAMSGLLCCNVFEETPSIGSDEYAVTLASSSPGKGTTATTALARNTFRIVSPQSWKASQSDGTRAFQYEANGAPLCYGEPFFLVCNEALLVDDKSVLLKPPLFLKSGLKTERSMSPITYNQRVWLSAEAESSALWVCARADLAGTEKLLAAGGQVHAGDAIAVVHKMTGQPLFADPKNKQPTDFGVELEVCVHGAKHAGKYHNIGAEALGTRTADTEGRLHLAANTWTFLLAATAQEALDERCLPDPASPQAVAFVIQKCLMTASLYAFRSFVVDLQRAETKGSGHVSREEAKWKIKSYKLPLRDEHLDVLFDSLDKVRFCYLELCGMMENHRKADCTCVDW